MANPELSVIVPCWNVEQWVEDSLRSVLTALPPRAEVIAVDDGSPDATGEILARLAREDGRLRVITQPNGGVSSARNRALDAATGDYVFFVDPDDTVEPDFFRAMLAAIRADNADYCVCAFMDTFLKGDYRFDSPEAIRTGFLNRIFGYSFEDIRAWYRGTPLFATREMAGVCRAVFRREIIERHHVRFDESVALYEDSLFNAEYLLHARRMTCVNRILYRVRSRDTGAMRRLGRDAAFVCRNKLRLLARRNELDALSGGRLAPLYAGSCVLGALEIFAETVRGRLPRREGFRILRAYLGDSAVRRAFRGFPLSPRKPLVALAVAFLGLFARDAGGRPGVNRLERRAILRRAFIDSVPVLMGYTTMGFVAGVLLAAKGGLLLAPLWALLTSALWVTGTMSIAGVPEIARRAPLYAFALMTLAVNFRYAFYGFSLLARWKDVPLLRKLYLILMLTDENYALEYAHAAKDPAKNLLYCTALSVMNHSYWIVGLTVGAVVVTVLGHMVDPGLIRRYTNGMEFSMASLFIVILTDQILNFLRRKR